MAALAASPHLAQFMADLHHLMPSRCAVMDVLPASHPDDYNSMLASGQPLTSDASGRSWDAPSDRPLYSHHSLELSSSNTRAGQHYQHSMSMAAAPAPGPAMKAAPCYAIPQSCVSPRAAQLLARSEFDCIYESSLQQVEILDGVPVKGRAAAVAPAACATQPGIQQQYDHQHMHQHCDIMQEYGAQQHLRRHSACAYEKHDVAHRQLMTTAGPSELGTPPGQDAGWAAGRGSTCQRQCGGSATPDQPRQPISDRASPCVEPAVRHSSPRPVLDLSGQQGAARAQGQGAQGCTEAPAAHAAVQEQDQEQDQGAGPAGEDEAQPGDPPAFLSTSASIANACANCGSRQTPGCWRRGWHIRGYLWANLCNRWAAGAGGGGGGACSSMYLLQPCMASHAMQY